MLVYSDNRWIRERLLGVVFVVGCCVEIVFRRGFRIVIFAEVRDFAGGWGLVGRFCYCFLGCFMYLFRGGSWGCGIIGCVVGFLMWFFFMRYFVF